jgi:hypothetical protein
VLGLIFFMAGVWKIFQLGPLNTPASGFCRTLILSCPCGLYGRRGDDSFCRDDCRRAGDHGLRTRDALVALGFVLAIVTFGHLLSEPLYEFHTHVIPRLALLLFILMLPREDDRFSLDHLLQRRKPPADENHLA